MSSLPTTSSVVPLDRVVRFGTHLATYSSTCPIVMLLSIHGIMHSPLACPTSMLYPAFVAAALAADSSSAALTITALPSRSPAVMRFRVSSGRLLLTKHGILSSTPFGSVHTCVTVCPPPFGSSLSVTLVKR